MTTTTDPSEADIVDDGNAPTVDTGDIPVAERVGVAFPPIHLSGTLTHSDEERAAQAEIAENLRGIRRILRQNLVLSVWKALALMWIICWMAFQ